MKNNTWLTDKYIAHRGLFDNITIPENSLSAFNNAVQNNFAIETDVQMTSDGYLVVFHDDTLMRMTGEEGLLCEKTYEQLTHLRLLNTDCRIPTFDEFLKEVNGKVELVIEIKTHKNIGVVEQKIVDRLKTYNGQYCIESFNPFIVRWFKKHAPHIVRGQLSCDYKDAPMPKWQCRMLKNLRFSKWNGSQFIAYNAASIETNKFVAKFRKRIPVLCWTIKSQQQHNTLRTHYDNIIFDSFVPIRDDIEKE
ncbi:MAG: hypothetical protein NC350_05620 [Corallococcus sp.]|nr:hypothetical protein [Corallococcus sp.]